MWPGEVTCSCDSPQAMLTALDVCSTDTGKLESVCPIHCFSRTSCTPASSPCVCLLESHPLRAKNKNKNLNLNLNLKLKFDIWVRRAEAGKLEAVRCTLEDVETLTSPWDKSPEAWRKSVRAGCEALRQAIISEGAYQPGSLQQFLVSVNSPPNFCQPFRPSLLRALEGEWHAQIACYRLYIGISLQGGFLLASALSGFILH